MFNLSFLLLGGGDLDSRLVGLRLDSRQKSKFARLVGAEMVNSTEERFANQSDPNGSPWLPSKRAIEQGGKTLRDTGRLMASLNWQALPNGVKWGTNVIYAPMMQFGGKKAQYSNLWGDIPARPFLGINDSDVAAIKSILTNVLGG